MSTVDDLDTEKPSSDDRGKTDQEISAGMASATSGAQAEVIGTLEDELTVT